ncbi:MAG TPA: DUF5916 domain-containing protein [Vicinamibacterales bacterium]
MGWLRIAVFCLVTVVSVAAFHQHAAGAHIASASGRPSSVEIDRPSASATPATGPIRVDGSFDEPIWQLARPIGPLVQREPNQGRPATEETDVRVVYTADALYVGILCRDRTPGGIVSTQLTRDADLEVDDSILVILDPFLDNRNGFFFQVNPAGARADGQVSNNAEHASRDWDGIWNAAARITADGWVAEIEIPFKTLRFKPGQTTWGLNVERRIKRLNETDRWAGSRQDVWISNLSEAGRLEGISGIRQGRGLDIRPYVSGGAENGDGTFQPGIDIFKNLTPNLNASVTVNTDFAETEADDRQINLTRFPLFYPEKRAFFLEGAGVFDVAGLGGFHVDLLPFFSRRLGLNAGEQVPILAGAKVIGRQADYNIGILDVQTRRLEDASLDGQNLLAARVSRNLFTQSWIGAIFTRGNPAGTGSNTLVGADARFATSKFRGDKNLSLSLFVLRTDDETLHRADFAAGASIDYPNDLWDVSFRWKQIGNGFEPALGFVPRRGIRKTSGRASFQPRPGRWGIRQFRFEFGPEVITNLDNVVENWAIETTPINFVTESGEHVEFGFEPQFERLPEAFEIADGIAVLAGSYRWNRYSVGASTADKRWWVVEVETGWGGFYDGTRRQVGIGLIVKPSTHFRLGFNGERNVISLPGGDFVTSVYSGKADFNFSPNVSWSNLVQYDSESRELGVQSRFRWILKPGNDIFLVLNRGWSRDFRGLYHRSFDRGTAKLQYTVRL